MARNLVTRQQQKTILLMGDKIDDRYLLPRSNKGQKGAKRDWETHRQWTEYKSSGGVEMLQDMLKGFDLKIGRLLKPGGNQLQSLAILENCDVRNDDPFPKTFKPVDTNDKPKSLRLRVREDLGYRETNSTDKADTPPSSVPKFDVLAISDAGNDLRRSKTLCRFITKTLNNTNNPVVLKSHLPLGQGKVWEAFRDARGMRRILIVHSDDLRQDGAVIRRGVPWDRVVEDLRECTTHAPLSDLLASETALVVLFGVEAAAVFEPGALTSQRLSFVFDPVCAEGQVDSTLPGAMVGYMNAFTAALIKKLTQEPDVSLDTTVEESLMTMRAFAQAHWREERGKLAFDRLHLMTSRLKAWANKKREKQNVPHYIKVLPKPFETVDLLRDILDATATVMSKDMTTHCFGTALEIIKKGARAQLRDLPHAEFGELLTLDVSEIEALRAIATLIDDYNVDQTRAKPISFAVFGPPGAGKSFGVRQLVDDDINPVLEFNLSQATEDDLPLFFQKIRDQNLKGKTPLCFFDEFDSGKRQLLKYFLAPMQDGEYRDGDAIRPIGRGIFVFAGGTASNFQSFAGQFTMTEPDQAKFDKMARTTKSLDFISRLSGYLNVAGIKSDPSGASIAEQQKAIVQLFHRAILIRSMLERFLHDLVPPHSQAALSDELIKWLLKDWEPIHGARSVETVIRGIAANRRTTQIGLSDLPMDILTTVHMEDKRS